MKYLSSIAERLLVRSSRRVSQFLHSNVFLHPYRDVHPTVLSRESQYQLEMQPLNAQRHLRNSQPPATDDLLEIVHYCGVIHAAAPSSLALGSLRPSLLLSSYKVLTKILAIQGAAGHSEMLARSWRIRISHGNTWSHQIPLTSWRKSCSSS